MLPSEDELARYWELGENATSLTLHPCPVRVAKFSEKGLDDVFWESELF
jgi:hypothetical protein